MTDRTSTQLYFVGGLLAALVLMPVLALAADQVQMSNR
jgi:hypothetical protein